MSACRAYFFISIFRDTMMMMMVTASDRPSRLVGPRRMRDQIDVEGAWLRTHRLAINIRCGIWAHRRTRTLPSSPTSRGFVTKKETFHGHYFFIPRLFSIMNDKDLYFCSVFVTQSSSRRRDWRKSRRRSSAITAARPTAATEATSPRGTRRLRPCITARVWRKHSQPTKTITLSSWNPKKW